MDELYSFGAWVRRRRRALDLTQDALARRVGVAVSMVRKVEADERRPSRQVAERLADALAVPAAEREQFLRAARAELAPDQLAPPAGAPPTPPALPAHRELRTRFPPLATADTRRHNLPPQLTSFVGCARDIAEVTRLLDDARLVTLTGPGGTGKTRLSLVVAEGLLAGAARFPDGVWLVELAPVAEAQLVPQAVAEALEVRQEAGRPMLSTLVDVLRGRDLLLVLDNCEHVVEASAQLAETLLRACPRLRLLTSGREALGSAGERSWRVPPLSLPADMSATVSENDLAALEQSEAVRLFVERAQAARPEFVLSAQNAVAIAQVCRRLDGIPLALELAAARVRHLTVAQIAARLDDRFRLLTGGARTALPRHQTLQALIDWSHDLLSADEQALLRRLAVFAGGWTLEGAEAVAGDAAVAALDTLAHLVDKSLVVVEEHGGAARYTMLETVRQYAAERLAASGEADAARRRHAEHMLDLVRKAGHWIGRREQPTWLERLDREADNLRAALGWALGGGDTLLGIEIACGLARGEDPEYGYWVVRGLTNDARTWLQRADEQSDVAPALLRARVRYLLADVHSSSGDLVGASALNEEAQTFLEREAANEDLACLLFNQGRIAWMMGDYPQAEQFTEGVLKQYQRLGHRRGIALALHSLGDIARDRGDLARGEALLEEGRVIHQELNHLEGCADSLTGLGDVAYLQGNMQLAEARWQEALALRLAIGNHWDAIWALRNLMWLALEQGDVGPARAQFEAEVGWWRRHGGTDGLSWLLPLLTALASAEGNAASLRSLLEEQQAVTARQANDFTVIRHLELYAKVAFEQGQPLRAVRLLGCKAASRDSPPPPMHRPLYERTLAALRAALSPEAFAAAWAAGQTLTAEQMLAEVLAIGDAQGEP